MGDRSRVRHQSPTRQAAQLLPLTTERVSSPRVDFAPSEHSGRAFREFVAAPPRRGRPFAAAVLLSIAFVLALGLLLLHERAESRRGEWSDAGRRRVAAALNNGNAVPYAGVSSPGVALHFGGATQNTTAGAAAAAAAAEITAALAACQQQAAVAAVSARSHEGSFPACLVSEDRQIGRTASKKQPPRSFLFNELSIKEIQSVEDALVAAQGIWEPAGGAAAYPQPGDDFVAQVEALPPPKADAVAWLAGSGPQPGRFARATVVRGSREVPDVQDFRVGPLEVMAAGEAPTITPLWADGQIPWVKHPLGRWALVWMHRVVAPVAYDLREVFRNFTGSATCYGAPANGAAPAGDRCDSAAFTHVPFQGWSPPGKRWTHIKFLFRPLHGDEAHLFPVPLSFQVDESSPRIEDWTVQNIEYCNQGPFASAAELLAANVAGELTHCHSGWAAGGQDHSWASTAALAAPDAEAKAAAVATAHAEDLAAGGSGSGAEQARTAEEAFAAKASARSYMPHGWRVSVNSAPEGTGAEFAWGEWSGHAKVAATSGLALHDLRFRGERIAYELSLQELQVVYNGFGGGGQIFLMDGYIGIGATSEALRAGHDCPAHATFVGVAAANSRWNARASPIPALCLFEEDAGMTEWRHSTPRGSGHAQVDGARRVALVLRSIATVGNYDYQMDVRLRLDGSIDVGLTAGGYMSTLFWQGGATDEEAAFGTVVQTNILAPLHDHLAGWKVDLDVAGGNNSFQTQTVRVGSYEHALAASAAKAPQNSEAVGGGSRRPVRRQRAGWHNAAADIVKYVETAQPGTEVGLRLNASAPAVWQFIAEDRPNAFGSPRGYAVSITGPTTHQLLPDGHPLLNAAAWTKYHLAVTVHKDEEASSVATRLDGYHPEAPAVSLDRFIDGESTDNQDLVAWVMVGLQHLPRSEDIPVVPNMGTGFSLKPWNYFDGLPSRHVRERPHEAGNRCAPPA